MYFPESGNTAGRGRANQKGDAQVSLPSTKLAFSTYAAASLVHLLKKQRDAFGLSLFSEGLTLHTDCRSTTAHQKFLFFELDKLLATEPSGNRSAIAATIHEIAEKVHRRSLVIIFTDMLESYRKEDELFAALQHLRHNRHEVVLFHVHDALHEMDFNYENRPYLSVDMENIGRESCRERGCT